MKSLVVGGKEMNYELRHFNTPLVRFSATEDSNTPEINILWYDEEKKHLLPLDLEFSEEGITRWLKHRTIPKNRAYIYDKWYASKMLEKN